MAVTKAMRETIWLRGLVENIGLHQGVTIMFWDNQSVIHLTKHQMYHKRTKHIDVRYHFIREIKVIKVKKIGTADNPTDIMKKHVPSCKLEHRSNCLVFKGRRLSPSGLEKTVRIQRMLDKCQVKWRSLLCIQAKVEISWTDLKRQVFISSSLFMEACSHPPISHPKYYISHRSLNQWDEATLMGSPLPI